METELRCLLRLLLLLLQSLYYKALCVVSQRALSTKHIYDNTRARISLKYRRRAHRWLFDGLGKAQVFDRIFPLLLRQQPCTHTPAACKSTGSRRKHKWSSAHKQHKHWYPFRLGPGPSTPGYCSDAILQIPLTLDLMQAGGELLL